MRKRHFIAVAGLLAALSASALFLMTLGERIILMTHYEWCLPRGCSDAFRFGAYAIVLAGCVAAAALAVWGSRTLILRLRTRSAATTATGR